MPAFHVPGMGFKIGSFLIKMVIEFEIKVLCLKIGHDKNARNRARKFPETVVNVLGL